jgi:cytochrome oxidase Cu insertion factor (SCO1/SenC/PrrC family)
VLRGYARTYGYNPDKWSFLTGDPIDIALFAGRVGQFFYEKDNTINHNLRTLVINADGTIRKIIPENNWTPEELAKDLKEASLKQ